MLAGLTPLGRVWNRRRIAMDDSFYNWQSWYRLEKEENTLQLQSTEYRITPARLIKTCRTLVFSSDSFDFYTRSDSVGSVFLFYVQYSQIEKQTRRCQLDDVTTPAIDCSKSYLSKRITTKFWRRILVAVDWCTKTEKVLKTSQRLSMPQERRTCVTEWHHAHAISVTRKFKCNSWFLLPRKKNDLK